MTWPFVMKPCQWPDLLASTDGESVRSAKSEPVIAQMFSAECAWI